MQSLCTFVLVFSLPDLFVRGHKILTDCNIFYSKSRQACYTIISWKSKIENNDKQGNNRTFITREC